MEDKEGLHQLLIVKAVIAAISIVILLCVVSVAYYHHASLLDFWNTFIEYFLLLLKVAFTCAAGYFGYKVFDTVSAGHHSRRKLKGQADRVHLQNEILRGKVKVVEQLPRAMDRAIDAGMNVEFEGFKATRWESNIHTISAPPAQTLIAPVIDFVPEPYKFSDVLQNWQPSKDGILLAKGRELITTPIGESLCHTTYTGNTDAGKTNNERELLIQLLFLEQTVYLCDRNYQSERYDQKLDTYYDYRPIERLLAHPPIDNPAQALALLVHLYSELEDRRARRRHNRVQFKNIYLVMDELPAFCGYEPDIIEYVGRFLRESRQYGIFFIGAAQDLLNTTLSNDNGAIRDNLLTNFYGGGDLTTARMVMNLPKGFQLDETGLGVKGCTYLRAKGIGIERVKTRTPLSDDLATHMLLADRASFVSGEAVTLPTQPVELSIVPREQKGRKATLSDAIEVWNEVGEIGRPRLQTELTSRGLECSEDLAKTLIRNVKNRAGGAGGA